MLLLIIAAAAFLSTVSGGLLALRLRDKLHLILGFSAGAVIGVAFFDLLPEAVNFGVQFHSPATILSWTALGFLFYLVLDRILLFHGASAPRGRFAAGVLCSHSLLDGIAIGLACREHERVVASIARQQVVPLAIEHVVAGIAHQNGAAEWAKICAGKGYSPGSIQAAARGKAAHEIALRIEYIDNSISRPGHGFALGGILHCIGDEQLVSD